MQIDCPTGLVLSARRFLMADRLELAHAFSKNEADGGLGRVIARCTEQIVNPGPYPTFRTGNALDIPRLVEGDLMYAAFKIRVDSMGPMHDFKAKCSECDRPQPETMQVNVNDFSMIPLSEEAREKLRKGESFETRVPSTQQLVRFKHATCDQASRLVKIKQNWQRKLQMRKDFLAERIMRPQEFDFLLKRVSFIEGLDIDADVVEKCDWALSLEWGDFFALEKVFTESLCGVDTTIKFVCALNGCGADNEVEIPLDSTFFRPSVSRKKEELEKETKKKDQPPPS